MKIIVSAKTDIGKERTNNEDAFAVCPDVALGRWEEQLEYCPVGKLGAIAIVADGMGGPNAGEVASLIAIESIKNTVSHCSLNLNAEADVKACLRAAIAAANEAILGRVQTDPDSIGMGTTVVIVWIIGNRAYVAWVGDSRCYLYNSATGLVRVTKDHSYVQELVDKGQIKEKDSFTHPDSNIITRCLGDIEVSHEPEMVTLDVVCGDYFLLCTDGLCGYVRESIIRHCLVDNGRDISSCCNKLVETALEAGGEDNITVSVMYAIQDDGDVHKPSWVEKARNCLFGKPKRIIRNI